MPVKLYPGTRVVQLLIHELDRSVEANLVDSKYAHSTDPETSKLYDDDELVTLLSPERQLIVGLTGPIGSGKSTVRNYLWKTWQFTPYSLGHEVANEALRAIGKTALSDLTREEKRNVANLLRRSDEGYFALKTLRRIREETKTKLVVVDGIMNPKEIDVFSRQSDFYLLAITADQETRFNRMLNLKEVTSKEEFDKIDRESGFGIQRKKFEQQLSECLKIARNWRKGGRASIIDTTDIESDSLLELYRQIDDALRDISHETGFRIV